MKTLAKSSCNQDMEKLCSSIVNTLRSHCTTRYDVECFITSLTDSTEFIQNLQMHRHDVVFKIDEIEEILKTHGTHEIIDLFKEISNVFVSGMILSGQCKTGNELIHEMNAELQSAI